MFAIVTPPVQHSSRQLPIITLISIKSIPFLKNFIQPENRRKYRWRRKVLQEISTVKNAVKKNFFRQILHIGEMINSEKVGSVSLVVEIYYVNLDE